MTIRTTLERAQAFASAMAHEHIPYGDAGRLWRDFLLDVEREIMAETTTKPAAATVKKPMAPKKTKGAK